MTGLEPPSFAIFPLWAYIERRYQSQMNGLWRFAAPFSFSRLSQHRPSDRRDAIRKEKAK
jgi:hypothetical protein